MCGRFTLTIDPAQMQQVFGDYAFPARFAPRYNIAPSQPVLAIPNDGKNTAEFMIWGLVPSWAKDPAIGNRLINARAETLAQKPSFRAGFRYRRCLILADGFYEWKAVPGTKTKVPYFIHLKSREPFAFAGLWDLWQGPEGSSVRSCTIITTEPNTLVATIHNRMPAILAASDYAGWVDPAPRKPEDLQPFLKPFSAEQLSAYPVSTLVNRPSEERVELLIPL